MRRPAQIAKRTPNPLRYAFSVDGSLDPGTKLLDIGLIGVTPPAALTTLLAQPLHMSVALHEITHFVSLENVLGHLMGFLAMRANTVGEAIADRTRRGEPIDASWIQLHAAWHHKYRMLLELWRPLLEGLAVYVQTHWPDEHGDALLDPVQLLAFWKVVTAQLGCGSPHQLSPSFEENDGDLTRAAYRAIVQGPRLKMSASTLAVSLELVQSPQLRPYFLGHAYVRAWQRELSQRCSDFASCEVFFALVMRTLRSSTRRLMRGEASWQQPQLARRVYGWIDTVRRAPAQRVAALRTQHDTVDVLHFLATGEEVSGYAAGARESVAVLAELLPEHWRNFESSSAREFARAATQAGDAPSNWTPNELATRLAGGWLRGAMSLNLCTDGMAPVVGWIEHGLAPLHALALEVDGAMWWLALSDEDLALLADMPATLPRLPARALLEPMRAAPTVKRVRIDCFTHYAPFLDTGHQMPMLRFALAPEVDGKRAVLAELAQGVPSVRRPHLRVLADADATKLHQSTLAMRQTVRDAPGPAELTDLCQAQGDAPGAEALRDAELSEEYAAVNVSAHVERRILSGVLGRTPTPRDLALPARGVAVVPGAAELGPLIAAAYSAPQRVSVDQIKAIERVNAAAQAVLGHALFDVDPHEGSALYCGLWGSDPARAHWVRARQQSK